MENIIDDILNNDIQERTDNNNKKKIMIIAWIIVWLIAIIWVAFYFFTSSKTEQQAIEIEEITETNKETKEENKKILTHYVKKNTEIMQQYEIHDIAHV